MPEQRLFDHDQAAVALMNWFRSQDIDPRSATMVCASVIIAAIYKMADDKEDALKGIEHLYRDMRANMGRRYDEQT